MRSPTGETTEDGIKRFLSQYRELDKALHAAHQSLNQYRTDTAIVNDLKNEVHTLKNALRVSKSEVQDLKTDASSKHEELSNTRDMLENQKSEREQERHYVESEMQKLKQQHQSHFNIETAKLYNENERIKTWYEERLRIIRHEEQKRLEQNFSSLKQQLSEEQWKWEAQLREVKETHEASMRNYQASFDEKLKDEYEIHAQQMQQQEEKLERIVREHQASVAQFKLEAEREEQRLHDLLRTEQAKLQEEQKRREKELKRQEAKLSKKHTQETFQLRTDNEELKQGLFHRQHFRGLKDRDLANLFRSITDQVQDFANVEWDGTLDWPFSEHQLLDIHRENTRKLKKQIVQNTIWALLYGWIFVSPFRILGLEGADLDREWIDVHTSSKSWIVALLRF